jgi:hypothetical protein
LLLVEPKRFAAAFPTRTVAGLNEIGCAALRLRQGSRKLLAMKRLLLLTSVTTTSVAFAALCAGAGVANADGFSQTNLVLDMPGLANITDSSLVNSWGVSFANGESHLDFEPGQKYSPVLSGDG